jgi:hypothetical protein
MRSATSRLCSTIESVTPTQPLPVGQRPILPGLRSPSRSFLNRAHPSAHRSHDRPRRSRGSTQPVAAPFRTCTRLRASQAHDTPPCGGDREGDAIDSRSRRNTHRRHLAPVTDIRSRRTVCRPGSTTNAEALAGLAPGTAAPPKRRDDRIPDVDEIPRPISRETSRSPRSPEPDRSQVSGRHTSGEPEGVSQYQKSLSGAEVHDAVVRPATRLPGARSGPASPTFMGFVTSKSAPRSVPRSATGSPGACPTQVHTPCQVSLRIR